MATAVRAQVHDEAVDAAFGLELVEQAGHVARRARIVFFTAAARSEVLVEARHGDDANLVRLALERDLEPLLLGSLLLELDLVAHELDGLLGRARLCAGRKHLQAYLRAARTTDLGHDVVEPPADDVDGLRAAFADARDTVFRLELPIDLRRAARNDVHDLDVVVLELQRRTDAVVRQAHLDAVLLALTRRQVARVRVHVVGDRIHVRLEHVVRRQLSDTLVRTLVAFLQDFRRLGPGLARQHEPKRVALDVLPPHVVQVGLGGRPGKHVAIPAERLVDGVVGFRREQPDRVIDALAGAFAEQIEDVEYRLQIAGTGPIVEFVTQPVEARNIGGSEVHAIAVERIEVAVQDGGRQRVVEMR